MKLKKEEEEEEEEKIIISRQEISLYTCEDRRRRGGRTKKHMYVFVICKNVIEESSMFHRIKKATKWKTLLEEKGIVY